jgi:hypothetical protein
VPLASPAVRTEVAGLLSWADDLGLIEHPAPNIEAGDLVVTPDGREALVTARVEAEPGTLTALLEVAIAPTPLTSDDSIT